MGQEIDEYISIQILVILGKKGVDGTEEDQNPKQAGPGTC